MSLIKLLIIALFLLLWVDRGHCENITPRGVSYEFERKDDGAGTVCNIALKVLNYPEPELIGVRLMVVNNKLRNDVFSALSVDVGDIIFRDGHINGVNPVRVHSIDFISPSFVSTGRMYPTNGFADGGAMIVTGDPLVGGALFSAFIEGSFSIQFSRDNINASRTYIIAVPPSVSVIQKMRDCVLSLKY